MSFMKVFQKMVMLFYKSKKRGKTVLLFWGIFWRQDNFIQLVPQRYGNIICAEHTKTFVSSLRRLLHARFVIVFKQACFMLIADWALIHQGYAGPVPILYAIVRPVTSRMSDPEASEDGELLSGFKTSSQHTLSGNFENMTSALGQFPFRHEETLRSGELRKIFLSSFKHSIFCIRISLLEILADVLSEDTIIKWYKGAHSSKGKNVFLEQMKKMVEWLQSAEEGRPAKSPQPSTHPTRPPGRIFKSRDDFD